MRLENMPESDNVEDRRGGSAGGRGVMLGGGLGIGGVIIVLLYVLLGGNPQNLAPLGVPGPGGVGVPGPGAAYVPTPQEAQAELVVRRVLGDTERVWTEVFARAGRAYVKPRLVLYTSGTQTGCGFGDAATGPFYCPADQTVYIDLSFFTELSSSRFGAPGDFAQAYVIAHEVGHHVQHLLGWNRRVDDERGRASQARLNALSVRLELQADFLAGVWAHHADRSRQILEPGDLDEALAAAAAVGDDRLQRQSRGYAVPESFTHGTSAQRARWFRKGLETGDLSQGDTFSADPL